MSYLAISKEGIKYHRWDANKKDKHEIVEADGKVKVLLDGKEVFSATTKEEADEYFYGIENLENPWPHMRERIKFGKGISVGDILGFIDGNELMKMYISGVYPNFKETQPPSNIQRNVTIDNGKIIPVPSGAVRSQNVDINTILTISDESVLTIDGQKYTLNMPWSLIEFFEFIFRTENKPVVLGKKAIENPFISLLSPCTLEDITLGDIFKFVDNSQELQAFLGMYSWCNIKAFHDAAKKSSDEPLESVVNALEIYSYGEIHEKLIEFCHFYGYCAT